MTAAQQSPNATIWSTVLALAVPVIFILVGASLIQRSLSLPFEAGGPFVDVLVPIGVVGFGVAGFVTARRGLRQQEGRRGVRALLVVESMLAAVVILAGFLTLLLIYLLCGFYWTRDTC